MVYPARRARDFHEATYLARYFDTIEINTSFYQPPRAEIAAQWIERVAANPHFVFTAKLWQKFTHETTAGSDDEQLVRAGFAPLQEAGKLAAILLQFPYSFHRTTGNIAYLKSLLERFGDYQLVVEVRHNTWNVPEVYTLLSERRVGFCNIDQPLIGRSLQPSQRQTAPVAYIRLHGRRYDTWFSDDPMTPPEERYNYLYTESELAPWVRRVRKLARRSEKTFVIANNHFEAKSIVNALQFIHMLSGVKVPVPEPLREHYPQLDAIADAPPAEPTLFPK
jgi:uncharacterized protein YecE (DUF72 family)